MVASCFRPSEHVSLLSIAGEHFPCPAFQPTHNCAVELKTSHLDTWMPQNVWFCFQTGYFHLFGLKKKIFPIILWSCVSHCTNWLAGPFWENVWCRWCDGWVAFAMWDPRNQWKSVEMRKITSICHNLDRQETQYVSQSTYCIHKHGPQGTADLSYNTNRQYTMCEYSCEYLT